MVGQKDDIAAPVLKRRQMDGKDAEAVKEVRAEAAVGDAVLEAAVGRGNHAGVGGNQARRP